jgi:hypothetical protein
MSWKTSPPPGFLKAISSARDNPLPYFNGSKVYKARVIARNLSTLSEYTTTWMAPGSMLSSTCLGNYQVKAYAQLPILSWLAPLSNAVSAGSVITVDLSFGSLVPVELGSLKRNSQVRNSIDNIHWIPSSKWLLSVLLGSFLLNNINQSIIKEGGNLK